MNYYLKTISPVALSLSLISGIYCKSLYPTRSIRYKADAEWAIIGSGPAGIIVLGVLLDLGTDPKSIVWIDPEFNVGRLGKYYASVPGNAKTKTYIEFFNHVKHSKKSIRRLSPNSIPLIKKRNFSCK